MALGQDGNSDALRTSSTGRRPARVPGSAPLAIAAITALLRDVLANGIIRYSSVTQLGDVTVSVLPPDRINVGADEPNQLNVFMYRVEPQVGLPRTRTPESDGRRREVGLKLHYLVTAYGAQDFHGDILLGCAVHLLGGLPVLNADASRRMLQSNAAKMPRGSRSPVREALAASDVLDSEERISLTQEFLALEDTSKLWAMLQARYRPSATYEVSAVRIAVDD